MGDHNAPTASVMDAVKRIKAGFCGQDICWKLEINKANFYGRQAGYECIVMLMMLRMKKLGEENQRLKGCAF